ncbi:Nn.00g034700.m01.CDS01 [Neocucurbitaria sp. VM-36]
MPIDRPNHNNPRPLKPTLASNRTAKTPITPRLAVAPTPPSATPSQPRSTVRTSNGSTPRPTTTAHVDVTPVKAFLNSNVTPRSSSRKSRVGVESASSTPSSTPSATPTSSRPTSTIDFPQKEQALGYSALGVGGHHSAQSAIRPRSIPGQSSNHTTPTPRLPLTNLYSHGSSETDSAKHGSSMFFHANDAKSHEQPAPAPAPPKKAPTFFYANGKEDDTPRRPDVPSPPLSSVAKSQPESKFFHADSLSESKQRPPILTPPPISASPDILPKPSAVHGISLQPPSPTKEWAHLSYRKGASQVIRPPMHTRNSVLSILSGPNTPDVPDLSRRRSSTTSSAVKHGHAKSASLSSIDSITELRKVTSNEPSAMTPSPLHTENRIVSNVSLPDSIASAPSPPLATFSGLPSPGPTSPIKPAGGQSALELMNELAANARRERKVLDLEISNSSLLAINRSLEREVRKQKAELRRFRRMSRAGRFSVDTPTSARESFSATGFSTVGDLSDMSEEEEGDADGQEPEEEEQEEEELESSDSSFDESALSPTAQAERDEAHRLRDEKRLQLDLSKHRELLIDSQKMNQSLKRCLGWTEQLIKDGQKALDYQVHVSDVKLGGRVLVTEDDEATQTEESRGLLSPWSPLHQAMDALDSPFFTESDRFIDRDSGVDLDGLQPVAHGVAENMAPLGSPFEERIKHLQASIDALEAS